jgi:RNA polymerase sigma-70 factor (ECF subfamily)
MTASHCRFDIASPSAAECGNRGAQDEDRQKRSEKHLWLKSLLQPAGWRVVTGLLEAWGAGDDAALEQLLPLVEAELRRLVRAYMARERRGHTLQATALVNEAFLRLTGARNVRWQGRAHFLGISARLMRRVLVDHARARGYQKRGGGAFKTTLNEALVVSAAPSVDLFALDRALEKLAGVDARKSRVVEMRFFGG